MKLFYVVFALLSLKYFPSRVDVVVEAIVNGELVGYIENYKFMAGIWFFPENSNRYVCGATIISPRKVVTAAHCLHNKSGTFSVIAGTLNLYEIGKSINFTHEHVVLHPQYSIDGWYANDIAVIMLPTPFDFDSKVGEIKMVADGYIPDPGDRITILGYSESNSSRVSVPYRRHLRYITSTVANLGTYKPSFKLDILTRRKYFLANFKPGDVYLTNRGDSGSPVLTSEKKYLGIVSYDIAKLPEVYTLIGGHRDFLDNPRAFRGASNDDPYVRDIKKHKYVATLFYKNDKRGSRNLCSATIISSTKLLTAAHCVHKKYSVALAVGTIFATEKYITVNVDDQEIFVYPSYKKNYTQINNIAVIQLKNALKFDSEVGRIAMVDERYDEDTGDDLTVVGNSGGYVRHFISASYYYHDCEKQYKDEKQMYLSSKHVCVPFLDGDGGMGSGYSGGPVVTHDGRLFAIYLYSVGQLPGICTVVTPYRSFIENPKGFRPGNK